MATYKVIQDIEAEDKLIGPLTLRQSIYGGIAAVCGYLSFVVLTKGLTLLLFIFLPPTLFAAFFAFPWGRDQSTEIWALAKIRFYLKSRRRLWDQSGIKELVTITAPKREVKRRTNELSQPEVHSRLSALASTLDTRGWAVKNVTSIPTPLTPQSSDRLVDVDSLPLEVSSDAVRPDEDMLDNANARAHQLQEMVTAAGTSHKQSLLERMQRGDMASLPEPISTNGRAQWFTTSPVSLPQQQQSPAAALDEVALSNKLHEHLDIDGNDHLKTIQPLQPAAVPAGATTAAPTNIPAAAPAVTVAPDPATIHLSQRDDLNIATIARIAKGEDTNEVVIPLH